MYEQFFKFARERHAVYLRRQSGAPQDQWTQDAILRQYRFTNVFRELDRVTVWVHENIREPYANHRNLWLMLAIARYINWPDTLEYLIKHEDRGVWPHDHNFSPAALGRALDAWQALGNKVYTGAYMIRAESDPNCEWYSWSKQRYVAEVVIGRLWEDRVSWVNHLRYPGRSLENTWQKFQPYRGWGPFMAYEVVTDMRWTRYLEDAPDIMEWANPGPGARRGLNRIHGRDLKKQLPDAQCVSEMQRILDASQSPDFWPQPSEYWTADLGEVAAEQVADLAVTRGLDGHLVTCFQLMDWPSWEMRDVEHTLCEFDKWERVRLGQGKPRSKFP